MQDNEGQNRNLTPGVWILILLCAVGVILSFACGAAYTGIQSARQTAAKASLGQIESVLFLAQKEAEENGLSEPAGSFSGMLKSYSDVDTVDLTEYEKYVLDAMLEGFGVNRAFDFAVTRYEDGGGLHTYIYYFPFKGQTDLKSNRYYLMTDRHFSEHNT